MKKKKTMDTKPKKGGGLAAFARTYRFFCSDTAVLRGDREAVIYNCRRILCDSPTRICLALGRGRVRLCGHGLYCASFSAGTLTVRGRIASLHLCERAACKGEGCLATACEEDAR